MAQPEPEVLSGKALHGVGEYFYYGNYEKDSNNEENLWARGYQNYISNFIRTGDPNDWTGSPNIGDLKSKNNKAKVKFTEWNGNWFKTGVNKFSQQKNDPRSKRCNMLDKVDQYMLH